jgi:NADH:ubiquinone oxidoreductase subunit 6 (subunit J)
MLAYAGGVLASGAIIYRFADPWLALALLMLGALSAACFVVRSQHRPRRLVLRAEYQGAFVVLYASADMRVFNQVKRALQRAIENRPQAPWLGARAA